MDKNKADNISSKGVLFYCYCDLERYFKTKNIHKFIANNLSLFIRKINAINNTSYKKFTSLMNEYDSPVDNGVDYYFLIASKQNQNNNRVLSLKTINKLTSNGSNMPFQCRWGDNREPVKNTHAEAKYKAYNTFFTGMERKRDSLIASCKNFNPLINKLTKVAA